MHRSDIIVLLAFCNSVLFAGSAVAAASKLIPQILVEAEVVEINLPHTRNAEAQLEIQYVYVGPADLKGARFSVSTIDSPIGTGLIRPVPKEGEVGIWALLKKDDGTVVNAGRGYYRLYPGLALPSRLGVSPRYEQAKILAEHIGGMNDAAADKRWALCQRYARDAVPEVAAWAVYFANEIGGPDVLKVIHGLASDGSLSILVQVSVDDVLFKMDPAWGQSKDRFAMFERWVTRDYSGDPYVSRVFSRLGLASQHGGLSQGLLLALVERALTAKKLPGPVLQNLVWLVGTVSERSKDAAASYDILVKFIKESMDHDMRLARAQALKDYVPLNAERMADLRSVLNDLKDQEVKDVVSSAIKNAESNRSQK